MWGEPFFVSRVASLRLCICIYSLSLAFVSQFCFGGDELPE
jgi:hypothetical protein